MPDLSNAPWRVICPAMCVVAATITLATSPHSIISLMLYFAMFLAALRVIDRRLDITAAIGVFSFYVLATLMLYWTQRWALPTPL